MLNNIYLIIGIIVGCLTLVAMTITSITAFLKINESFRNHIERILKQHEEKLKQWFKEYFESFYYPLDDRIKNLNYRLKNIEKKCYEQPNIKQSNCNDSH